MEIAQTSSLNPAVPSDVQRWLVEKIAHRLKVSEAQIDMEKYLDEFGLDSTEALVLSGELEKWTGTELESTAIWYYPTISTLSQYVAERVTQAAS